MIVELICVLGFVWILAIDTFLSLPSKLIVELFWKSIIFDTWLVDLFLICQTSLCVKQLLSYSCIGLASRYFCILQGRSTTSQQTRELAITIKPFRLKDTCHQMREVETTSTLRPQVLLAHWQSLSSQIRADLPLSCWRTHWRTYVRTQLWHCHLNYRACWHVQLGSCPRVR